MTTLELTNEILNNVALEITELKFEYVDGQTINISSPIKQMYSIKSITELFEYVLNMGHSEPVAINACAGKIISDLKRENK